MDKMIKKLKLDIEKLEQEEVTDELLVLVLKMNTILRMLNDNRDGKIFDKYRDDGSSNYNPFIIKLVENGSLPDYILSRCTTKAIMSGYLENCLNELTR